jgi:hypothetical protein
VAVRLDGSVAWKMVSNVPSVAGFSTKVCDLSVPAAPGDAEIVFLRLMLLSKAKGAALARNVYWLSAPGHDFSALDAWRRTASSYVKLTLLKRPGADGEGGKVRVTNVSPRVAFFIRLSLRREKPPPPVPLPPVSLWRVLLQMLSRVFVPPAGHVVVTLPLQQPPPQEDDRVLPVYWSDTFVTLLPGEALDVDFAHAPLAGARTRLEASGWNVPLASVSI